MQTASTQPFIGITCSADEMGHPVIRPWYVRAVHDAGGLPVPLPFVPSSLEAAEILARLSGLVLTGSEDIDPRLFGENRHPATTLMHPRRHDAEIAYCRALMDQRLPCLAICGGMQTLNVVAGGTLAQHIPDLEGEHLDHVDDSLSRRHDISTAPGSRLAMMLGERFETNTHHHQAIGELAPGFLATAQSDDGIIEAYDAPAHPTLMAVQWHPERMPDDDSHDALFVSLVSDAEAQGPGGAPTPYPHRAPQPVMSRGPTTGTLGG